MKKAIFNFLYFTKSERNGTLLLCILIVISICIPSLYDFFSSPIQEPSFIQEAPIAFVNEVKIQPVQKENNNTTALNPFPFNPNTATIKELSNLGLSKKVSQTIINFRAKGGQFYQASDFKKIYGLTSEQYKILAPYIKISNEKIKTKKSNQHQENNTAFASTKTEASPIPQLTTFDPNTISKQQLISFGIPVKVCNTLINFRDKGGNFRQKKDLKKVFGISDSLYHQLEPFIEIQKVKKAFTPIDINQANQSDWESLSGIGPYYAKQILKLRDQLGGFHKVNQVAEAFRLPDSTFQKIKPFLIESPILRKIKVNEVSYGELKSHPYLTAKQAYGITNYRKQHGIYSSIKELSKLPMFDEKTIVKIEPYLTFD